MLISTAHAAAAGAAGVPAGDTGDAFMMQMMLIGVLFLIFWLLVLRPQKQRADAHKAMVEAIRRGDRVLTAGGLYGTVTKVLNDDQVQVEIADGVRVTVMQSTIHEVLNKSEPAPADSKPANTDKNKADKDQ